MIEGKANAPAQGANQYSHGNCTYVFEVRHTTIDRIAIVASNQEEARRRILGCDPAAEHYDSEPGHVELTLRRIEAGHE